MDQKDPKENKELQFKSTGNSASGTVETVKTLELLRFYLNKAVLLSNV